MPISSKDSMCGKASSNSSNLPAWPVADSIETEIVPMFNLRKFGGKITLGERGPSISKSSKDDGKL